MNGFGDVPIQPIPAIRMERVEDATKWGKPSNGWMMKDSKRRNIRREKKNITMFIMHTTKNNDNDNDIVSEKASRRALKEPTKQNKTKQNIAKQNKTKRWRAFRITRVGISCTSPDHRGKTSTTHLQMKNAPPAFITGA
mmetsp:Transcript_7358/g.18470  ORF Transcript_7358/g.18470 Transcript_7358/m.18470 type:complete len:139 (+) Transcript_7358:397-813(+)